MGLASEKVEFIGHDGKSRLAARFDAPKDGVHAVALFAHCFTCSKDVLAASRIAAALAAKGIAVLRFDFTGLGGSEGEFANTHFTSNVADLVAAARFLEGRGQAPQVLIGHSLGGAAVLVAAAELPSVRAVATIGAPADPSHVAHLFRDRAETIAREGAAEVQIAGRGFTISRRFLEDIREQKLIAHVRDLRRALLILHAPRDAVVGIDNATEIFRAAKHPKSFVSLDDADHLLTRQADAAYVAEVVAAWAGRYVGGDAAAQEPAVAVPDGWSVLVAESGPGPLTQSVRSGRHALTADEPESLGGDDLGPNPHRLVLAGLGACTSMTLRMYVRRKGWEIGRISVALRLAPIDRDDAKAGTRIERRIAVDGPLTAAQRDKLLEIAGKCPVHRTLTGLIEITAEMAQEVAG